jgi:hypothetical protein
MGGFFILAFVVEEDHHWFVSPPQRHRFLVGL